MQTLILDISTAALENVSDFLETAESEARRPPSNYTKPEAVAEWRRKDYEADLSRAALDIDLARITGIATTERIELCHCEEEEIDALVGLADAMHGATLISYNGLSFDWPMLMRRSKYLGVKFPTINCDRYRSPHKDLLHILSGGDPQRKKSLGWYVRRLGYGDLIKPLSGAEEAKVFQTGQWAELEHSLMYDAWAIKKLSEWIGLIEPSQPDDRQEPLF